MEPTNGQCGVQPSILFLVLTLLVTGAATGLLCSSLMGDHWEYVTWDRGKLDLIASKIPKREALEWFLNGQVGRVNLSGHLLDPTGSVVWVSQERPPSIFFVPMYGGLWTLCTLISEEDTKALNAVDFPTEPCYNYLTPEVIREDGGRTDWQHRMQNLSISCALVCLIILGCSALVGAFGVIQQQISAVLVTGVMYLLAATFAFFTLAIIHFKRAQIQAECARNQTTLGLKVDGVLLSTNTLRLPYLLGPASQYLEARISSTGWSLQLGWGGVATCVLVSVLWILLSKIMRYNPLSTLLL